jgi:hypothetical protein
MQVEILWHGLVYTSINAGLPSLLARDAINFILENGERILKYRLVGGVLSVITAPPPS